MGTMLPNNSLMLTRLAGENGRVRGLPSSHTMECGLPEPPGSIARGRWAAVCRNPCAIHAQQGACDHER
jgi:hypothetical protein